MELGRLEDESTAALCRRMASESRTGCLHLTADVEDGALQADLYLREGRIYTATAPGGRARLADRLIGSGDLTPEQLEVAQVLKRSQPESTRLGDVLVASGMVDRERLRTVIREQIVDSVAVPLGWTAGSWRFEDGEAVVQDIPLGLGIQDTLMEASRRLGQIEVIQTHMGSMDTVVDFPQTGEEAKLSLKPDEWAMLTHIDGLTSVADIAEHAGYTQLETARIIYGLLVTGVVVRVDGEEATADPATDRPAPTTLPMRQGSGPTREPPPPEWPTAPAGDLSYLEELESLGQLGPSPWAQAAPPSGPPAVGGAAQPRSGAPAGEAEDPARTAPHGMPAVPVDTATATPPAEPPAADAMPPRRAGRLRGRFRRGG
ncbi:MAG TPA: DUF4388 domain-containing protein [Euzebya sp.]|nr:DUF4388 domain-containing protein [Euzebya sp.]